ncbi:MAG: hypothetical protein KKB37_16540 [Alphaproteobacteria bacterium]|nr:hypothetical protein [Alphaproteobacteria bacterium]
MTFSQGWDAGFKSVLIFIGTVFVWLGLVERFIPDRGLSELLMTAIAALAAMAFFMQARRHCLRESREAAARMAAAEAEMRHETESFGQ